MGPEGVRHEIAARAAVSATGLANSLRGTGQGAMPPVWEGLGGVRSPLLAVAGSRDPAYVAVAERLASVAPAGRTATVDGAGHALPMEQPAAVAHIVCSFLEGLGTEP